MAKTREALRVKLESINEVSKTYYTPPDGSKMQYPCIIYKKDNMDVKHADNKAYATKTKYLLKIIADDPDTVNTIATILIYDYNAKYVNGFESDDLYHELYTIYF